MYYCGIVSVYCFQQMRSLTSIKYKHDSSSSTTEEYYLRSQNNKTSDTLVASNLKNKTKN